MSASLDAKFRIPRGIVRGVVAETTEFALKSARATKSSWSRRLFLGCEHAQLVVDDINDVYCEHCGEDFTD